MTNRTTWIELDGSQGEGGGQILRTALTLSMITGKPLRIARIRAGRSKPGLLRQHLTAVKAAALISGAEVQGDELGSQALQFMPGPIRGGDYHFAISTAGSCTLVLQTILPALWFADAPSQVLVSGGTHNPMAPPADFLQEAWLPLLSRMGVNMDISLLRHGFNPAGGGEVCANVQPVTGLLPLHLLDRGQLVAIRAEAKVAGVPEGVARRELTQLARKLTLTSAKTVQLPTQEGPGNAVIVIVQSVQLKEVFCGFGEIRLPAERVANRVAGEVRRYLGSKAIFGEHLADQLVLPMALAGEGCFTTTDASSHLVTNLAVIERFLPVKSSVTEVGRYCWRVDIQPRD